MILLQFIEQVKFKFVVSVLQNLQLQPLPRRIDESIAICHHLTKYRLEKFPEISPAGSRNLPSPGQLSWNLDPKSARALFCSPSTQFLTSKAPSTSISISNCEALRESTVRACNPLLISTLH